MSEAAASVVLAALRDEARFVERDVHVTGMGAARVCETIDRLKPRAVLLIGFAGGLNPTLRTGDTLHIGRVLHDGDEPITLAGNATLLTVDELADTPQHKQALHERTRADAVDMETYFVARYCRDRGIRLDVLRAISDPADAVLPRASVNWVKPDGSHDVGAALRHLAMHPLQLPALIRLGGASKRAARALGERVATWPTA